ncbi:MAG TPA: two-component regulator propeller domain-containing protein [Candidatus Brocadiia bacterium]|nr:two-component regulator propeller domain-containing protein [Candidatus Brocadiia bacterium]
MKKNVPSVRVSEFKQETCKFFRCGPDLQCRGVTALAMDGDDLYVGNDHGMGLFDGRRWRRLDEPNGPKDATVLKIHFDSKGNLWVATVYGLYVRRGAEWTRYAPDDGVFWKREPVAAKMPHEVCTGIAEAKDGAIYVSTLGGLVRFKDGRPETVKTPGTGSLSAVAIDRKGRVWIGSNEGVCRLDGKKATRFARKKDGGGELQSNDVRCIAVSPDGDVWVGTRRGISVCSESGKWRPVTGEEGLPFENVNAISFTPGGDAWIGTMMGACRWDGGRWHYYFGQRWLISNVVTTVCNGKPGSVWLGSPAGLVRIDQVPMTLEKKAALFDDITQARHNRMDWIADSHLARPGDLSSNRNHDTDNDGLWTALYVAAESFRYAVTGDIEAQRNAKNSFHAMLRLEEMSDIDGFPTKAIIHWTQAVNAGPLWVRCKRYPEFAWKGDCSSDEIDGHMFGYSIYYDLAADEREKELVREITRKIMDHIIDNGYILRYLDGKHTRWGVWGPQYLSTPEWAEQLGLNSLEILSHLKAAYHITGDEKYQREYLKLALDHNYAQNTVDQKIVTPTNCVNHSDDELASISYYPLMIYETDPKLMKLYRASMERTYEVLRSEESPFNGFIYTATTGNDCGMIECVRHLQEVPLDLVRWTAQNSHRSDIEVNPACGRFGGLQGLKVIPPDERAMSKWNSNPFSLDGGAGGHAEEDGAFYLLPYWMGRYHGFIKERS